MVHSREFSIHTYRCLEATLLRWSEERAEALLIRPGSLHQTASTTQAHNSQAHNSQAQTFCLFLSPQFNCLLQQSSYLEPGLGVNFQPDVIRRFAEGLFNLDFVEPDLLKRLRVKLEQVWPPNDADDHSQFLLAAFQPPESRPLRQTELLPELQEAWDAVRTAERAKEEFMALMSHELRTPLTCVIGMSATMLRWSFGPLSDRQRNCLQTIHDSGNHLMQIIDSILELSQAASGKTALNIHPLSLRHTIKYCVQLFQETAFERGIELRTSSSLVTPEDDVFIGDVQRLRQILINLLDNAIKFTEIGGTVRVRISREDRALLLRVEDTGIGIDQRDRDRLFQTFQQLEASHRRRFGGTGLGLALTKQLVDLHGGKIEIESNPGQGSRFVVWLPEQAIPPRPHKAPIPQGEVVLLEEDESSATLICELLTAAGYKVFWLVDSSTALEQIQMLHPVAVIVNLQFQGSSGEELVRHVRQIALAPIPRIIGLLPREVVGISAATVPEPGGVDAYVFTPFHPEELVAQLDPFERES